MKYANHSKNMLKKSSRKLKNYSIRDINEIKYVSHLLRNKLKGAGDASLYNHNERIKQNYWKYCKNIFESEDKVQPTFDESTCFDYFQNIFQEKQPHRKFEFPSWMKMLNEPTHPCNLDPPTYKEIQKIITKMKSSGSPCPIDHLSIIALKNCPILRTQLWRICKHCWENKYFPDIWKNSATILIHKKGSEEDPGNFRPITLEPVLSKVMTSLIRNRIFSFVLENKFIECDIQKWFWTGLSGTIEHTELLTHIIRNAKKKQKQLVVTLFDLKNAFGEVNHNFIRKVLKYHHIPSHISDLITSLYTNYYISVCTEAYQTHPVKVNRGVLQGDCLSPLIFNLCVNTLIECIKREEVKCLGYVYSHGVLPRHWFQFADDTAIVSALEEDNQLLCNAFNKWTTWGDLIIRIDKCHTFGVKKSATSSVQYYPMILVNRQRIPPIEMGESFIYLGKKFNFGMTIDNIKAELKEENISYITTIDKLPLTSLNKISIIQKYVYSKYRWVFSIYDLTETWVVENIDTIIGKYLRKWFQLPACANIKNLSFPTSKLGVNFPFAKTVYQKCKLSIRRILSQSKNIEIRNLYKATSLHHVPSDSIVNSILRCDLDLNVKQVAARTDQKFEKNQKSDTWNEFMELKEQNVIIKHIVSVCPAKVIAMWQGLVGILPNNIVCFIRKALLFCLPNKSNLFRWKITENNKCIMCQQPETQLHILSNCCKYLDRYKWRHDSILKTLLNKISRSSCDNIEIFADCEEGNYPCTSDLFEHVRPDIVVLIDSKVIVIELTVCFDTNTEKSRQYKQNRYKNIKGQILIPYKEMEIVFLEFTTLGFISKSSYTSFNLLLGKLGIIQNRTVIKCMETAIRGSYYIFCRRNKAWTVSELLNFY